MEEENNTTCQYCKNTFKNYANLIKHQTQSKYCLDIQKKNFNDNDYLDTEIKNLIEENKKRLEIEFMFKNKIDERNNRLKIQEEYQNEQENKLELLRQQNIQIEIELQKTIIINSQKLELEKENGKNIDERIQNLKQNVDKSELDLKKILEGNSNKIKIQEGIQSQIDDLNKRLESIVEENKNKMEIEFSIRKKIEEKNEKLKIEQEYQNELESKIESLKKENTEIEFQLQKKIEETTKNLKINETLNEKIKESSKLIEFQNNLKQIIQNNIINLQSNLELKIEDLITIINKEIYSDNINKQNDNTTIEPTIEPSIEPSIESTIEHTSLDVPIVEPMKFKLNFDEMKNNISINSINIDDYSLEQSYGVIIDKILSHIKLFMSEKYISSKNILYIIVELMKFIENFNIKNLDKKQIVIYSLKKFINLNGDSVIEPDEILLFINKFISDLIDISISIDNKKIRIKYKNKSCFVPIFS
jgi:hypothetical protein